MQASEDGKGTAPIVCPAASGEPDLPGIEVSLWETIVSPACNGVVAIRPGAF